MATYDLTTNLGLGIPFSGKAVGVIKNTVDLNTAGASGAAPVAADVIKVLRVPKGSVVLAFGGIVKRIAAGTSTFDYDLTLSVTSSKGATITSTSPMAHGGTGTAVGTMITLATLTDPGVDAKATSADSEDVYLTATIGTLTTITDLGQVEFFAVVAEIE